jgi:hypothetical protein
MKKRFAVPLVIAALVALAACARSDPKDGTVQVEGAGGGTLTYRLVEICKTKDGNTCVFFQGSGEKKDKETFVCTNEFSGDGFKWKVHIGASIACGGKQYEPIETIPYLSGRPGNVVCFVFDTKEDPESITVYKADNKDGAATLAVSDLKLDPELSVSDKIAEIAD